MAVAEVAEAAEARERSKGHLRRAMERLVRKKIAIVCMVVLAIIYFAGIFAPLVAPYDYTEVNYMDAHGPDDMPAAHRSRPG
ncbi:MAG: hypothetical protein OXG80_03870, partial [Chloroflexi bacterium]|nr:hypothetical protein [Chloroflexota bacterium]